MAKTLGDVGLMKAPRYVAMVLLTVGQLACGLLEPGGLRATVNVDPTTLAPNDTATVTVTVRNASNDVVALTGSSSCTVLFQVWDTAGTARAPFGGLCTADLRRMVIGPHDSVSSVFRWAGTVADGSRLPAGMYRVQALISAAERPALDTPATWVEIQGS